MAAEAGKRSVPSPALVNAPVPLMGEFQTSVEPVPTLIPPPPAPSTRVPFVTVSVLSRRKIEPLSKNIEDPGGVNRVDPAD